MKRTYTDADQQNDFGYSLRHDSDRFLGGLYVRHDRGVEALITGKSWALPVEVWNRVDNVVDTLDRPETLARFGWLIMPTPDFEALGMQTARYEGLAD